MPWTVADVERFNKGLSPSQKRTWVSVANGALERCKEKEKSDCEASAIKQANAVVRGLKESGVGDNDSSGVVIVNVGEGDSSSPPESTEFDESIELIATSDAVPLVEAHVRKDGTVPLRLISPGWGSKGYYSPELLKKAAKDKVFKSGLKMYWDHPTISEASERPERSLRDLAAVLETDARYMENGAHGAGLYANARVFEAYRAPIEELAPHIGPSIRASGAARWGEAEGRKGPIIEEIFSAQSVDFVTSPGRGGAVLQLFEAARPAEGTISEGDDGGGTSHQESDVELQEVQRQLTESQTQVTQLTEARDTAIQERDAASLRATRAEEKLTLRDARDVTAEALAKATGLPEITRKRLLESIAFNPPVTENGELDKDALATKIAEAVTAEVAYLKEVMPDSIQGMGDGSGASDSGKKLTEAFGRLGLSESAADIAGSGRN